MAWAAVAALGIGVVSDLFSANKFKSAASDARRLSALNAEYIIEEGKERGRRLFFEQSQITGAAKTGIAASGFRSGATSMGKSHRAYLDSLAKQQLSERDWLGRSTRSRAKIAREGGDSAASQLRSQAFGQYARAGQGLFSIYSEVYNG